MDEGQERSARERWGVPALTLLLGVVVPLGLLAALVGVADDVWGWDHRYAYHPAALDLLDRTSPYVGADDPRVAAQVAYVYPPVLALLLAPLTPLGPVAGATALTALMLVALLAGLVAIGVRDWRCHAAVLGSPWLFDGLQHASVSVGLAAGVALVWRLRDRVGGAAALGALAAVKLVLAPLAVWLAATGRLRGALVAAGTALALVLGPWALIGFAGLGGYPELLDRLAELESRFGYAVSGVLEALGLHAGVARALALLLAAALLAAAVVAGRRSLDARSFTLALLACLAASPIVWQHYWLVLLVPLGLARPSFSAAWLAPWLCWPGLWGRDHAGWRLTALLATAALAAYLVRELGSAQPRTSSSASSSRKETSPGPPSTASTVSGEVAASTTTAS